MIRFGQQKAPGIGVDPAPRLSSASWLETDGENHFLDMDGLTQHQTDLLQRRLSALGLCGLHLQPKELGVHAQRHQSQPLCSLNAGLSSPTIVSMVLPRLSAFAQTVPHA